MGTIDENLTLNNHISKMLKGSYSHLSILKKLKRYTSQSVRKQLVELLFFSRLDYCNNLFIDRKMIKLQKSCASFVEGKYCSIEDVISLKWLLAPERIDFTALKMTFKGLSNEKMPSNLNQTTSHNLSNMQQHYVMKFQNQYKKLKNIVVLSLSWKGISLTKH